MVNNCANPQCVKQLHYLREGRIYVFDLQDKTSVQSVGGKHSHHLEHFWLCGPCSGQFKLELENEAEVRLVPRKPPVCEKQFHQSEPCS